jgi:hydroxyacylglutathione hydrolase
MVIILPVIDPVVDEGLGNSSYVVDVGSGEALVVDPARDPRPYLDLAAEHGLRVAWTLETHLHADFVSGSKELAALGATVLAPGAARLGFPSRGLAGGDEAGVGRLALRALATPGHAPEHLSYLLLDAGAPVALFSGGALLPGAVARPDLVAPDATEPLARAAWRSLGERLLPLPDELVVYPTHGAGSFCAANASEGRITTIGAEREGNPLLHAAGEDEFVAALLGGLGTYPPYFLRLRAVNQRGPRVVGTDPVTLARLEADAVELGVAAGALLVDARPIGSYAGGHPAGALSIALRSVFSTWLGWLARDDVPLVFLLEDGQDRDELVWACLNIGYERLAGELDGGMAAWRAAGLAERGLELIDPDELGDEPVLDVRQDSEYEAGSIPGALHIELGALRPDTDLPDGPLTIVCGYGPRAVTAASLLERGGRSGMRVLLGGADGWSRETGRPLAVTG